MQLAYFFRSELLVYLPDLKPYATMACETYGCDLPLPRRAENLSIEISDLQADPANPGTMVLSAVLRNRAPYDQAQPSLELTLTDAQDQPVVRRVINPADFLSDPGAAFAANGESPIRVRFEASAVQASGYRLYLFYP